MSPTKLAPKAAFPVHLQPTNITSRKLHCACLERGVVRVLNLLHVQFLLFPLPLCCYQRILVLVHVCRLEGGHVRWQVGRLRRWGPGWERGRCSRGVHWQRRWTCIERRYLSSVLRFSWKRWRSLPIARWEWWWLRRRQWWWLGRIGHGSNIGPSLLIKIHINAILEDKEKSLANMGGD